MKIETLEIYRNYGCLAHEKEHVYTHGTEHSTATCSDLITVKVPEGWEAYQNNAGKIIVESPWGWSYDVNDVLHGTRKPVFRALDSSGHWYTASLEEVEK